MNRLRRVLSWGRLPVMRASARLVDCRSRTAPSLLRPAGTMWWLGVIGVMLTAAGCETYALRGWVVEGDASRVTVVEASDPRLEGRPVKGARVLAVLDPENLGRERLPAATSDESGRFAIPVDAVGAGVLTYRVGVSVRMSGRTPAEAVFPLPGRGERVLVEIASGSDRPTELEEDVVEESLRHAPAW